MNRQIPNQRPQWMNDPLVSNIHPEKLEFLEALFREAHGKSQKELMMYLMPMLKKAKKNQLTLTPDEMQSAIQAIKRHSTQEELEKIEKLLQSKRK